MSLPVDPVYLILGTGTIAYIAQAAVLSKANPVQMFRRLYKDTTIGFGIVMVTALSSLYYMKAVSTKQYPFMSVIVAILIGMTLERKIRSFFRLQG